VHPLANPRLRPIAERGEMCLHLRCRFRVKVWEVVFEQSVDRRSVKRWKGDRVERPFIPDRIS
jgi:hypothetical protein